MAGRGSVCAIYGCNNYKLQKERKSFFRFPRQKELCTQWVILSKRPDLDDVLKNKGPEHLNKNYVVCSDHFQVKDFRNRNLLSQGLFKGSVPSQSLSKESSCQPTVKNNQLWIKQISQHSEDIEKPVTESTMAMVKEEFEEFNGLEPETVCTEIDPLGIMDSDVGCSEKDFKPSLDEVMFDSKFNSNKVDTENSLNRVDYEANDSEVENLYIKQERELSPPVESETEDMVKEEPADVDDLESLSSHCKMEHVDIKVEKGESSAVEGLLEKPEEDEVMFEENADRRQPGHPYCCPFCNRSFSNEGQRDRHLPVHDRDRLYSCNSCNKTFRRKRNLIQHILTHNDKYQYSCKICNKPLASNKFLKRHMRRHKQNNDQPFLFLDGDRLQTCNFCFKTFRHKSNLNQHMRTHSDKYQEKSFALNTFNRHDFIGRENKNCPFPCETCNKSFSSNYELEQHRYTHLKESNITCSVCNKYFVQKSKLDRHMRYSKISCKSCNQIFCNKRDINKHVRTYNH